MSLCIPMIHVLLHAVIDDLRNDGDKVTKMGAAEKKRWWGKASVWSKFARVGLPLVYMLVAFAIVFPGILNIITEGSVDNSHKLA